MADPSAGPSATKRGFLTKQGGGNKAKTWKRRLFVLEGHSMSYFKNEKAKSPLGVFSLTGCTVSKIDHLKKKHCFQVYHPIRRTFYMYADTEDEMMDWMVAIQEHIPRNDSALQTYKIVMLGAGGVGKSALTLQFVNNTFLADYEPTIEDSFLKQLTVDGQSCRLSILDTAGQEEYTTIRDQYIEVGEGFVLVFDITSAGSLEDVKKVFRKVQRVMEDLAAEGDELPPPPIVLVGNKVDLVDRRQVDRAEGEALASEFGCPYFETSALTRENVEAVFHEVTRIVRAANDPSCADFQKQKKCVIQ